MFEPYNIYKVIPSPSGLHKSSLPIVVGEFPGGPIASRSSKSR